MVRGAMAASGSFSLAFVGDERSPREYALGVSASRAAWLVDWYDRILTHKMVPARKWSRFLVEWAPAWCGRVGPSVPGTLGLLGITAQAGCLCSPTRLRLADHQVAEGGVLKRGDSRAQGDVITWGGWLPVCDGDGMPRTVLSPGYSIDLDRMNALWAC